MLLQALRLFGSDFLLIEQHFNRDEDGNPTPNKRTRNELKRKYDKENKTNPGRIDEALESMERGEGDWKFLQQSWPC